HTVPTRRSADTRPAGWVAKTVWPDSTSTPRSSRWVIPPASKIGRRAPALGYVVSVNKARRLSIQYAAGLACAHLLAVGDAAAIVIPLHDRIGTGGYAYFSAKNMAIAVVVIGVG